MTDNNKLNGFDEFFSMDQLREAVNENCTCGGRGPGLCGCPACEIWHWFKAEMKRNKKKDDKMMRDISTKALVEFCVLMQNGKGIIGKSPSYIQEKIDTVRGNGRSLDAPNSRIFRLWLDIWMPGIEEDINEVER